MAMIARVLSLATAILMVTSCTQRVPSPGDFTEPAVGTLMPGGHEEGVAPTLGTEQSGVLFVNQTGNRIQVAVNGTITDIPRDYDFLFNLPPGKYEIYIFEPNSTPHIHTETLEGGKLRYLYITPLGQPGG
jgi:hypothetical protein